MTRDSELVWDVGDEAGGGAEGGVVGWGWLMAYLATGLLKLIGAVGAVAAGGLATASKPRSPDWFSVRVSEKKDVPAAAGASVLTARRLPLDEPPFGSSI